MENYNPRQNTRMRWKSARELEKFVFISGPFAFTNNVLEHVSQDKLYERIIEVINSNIPVIVYDTVNFELYIGNVDPGTMYLTNLNENQLNSYVLDYDKENDKLTIQYTSENFISEDNVKTLFGEQSIIGQGNIDLYRHDLVISNGRTSYDDTEYKVYLTYYSSNNLVVNTPEKLTELTKATTNTDLIGIVREFANAGVSSAAISEKYNGVTYVGSDGWGLRKIIGGWDGIVIKSVNDIVTTI
jgi:hypothetical protein|nr:MAG TPA: hypothetical protein [Caudoviricetes sp.]